LADFVVVCYKKQATNKEKKRKHERFHFQFNQNVLLFNFHSNLSLLIYFSQAALAPKSTSELFYDSRRRAVRNWPIASLCDPVSWMAEEEEAVHLLGL